MTTGHRSLAWMRRPDPHEDAASHRKGGRRRANLLGYGLLAPAVVLVTVFKALPLFQGFATSATKSGKWVGLDNYALMLHDDIWITSLFNAARGLLLIPIFVLLPLVLAYVLFEGVPGWRFFRAIFLLSYLLPAVMTGAMWSVVLRIDGPLSTSFHALGLDGLAIAWLGEPATAFWTIYAIVFWSWFGLGVAVYLAGLGAIPSEQFDAARVDGSGFLSTLRYLVLPSLLPTISYWAVFVTAGLLLWMFAYVYSTTQGGPGYSSMLPEYYIYRVFSESLRPGYAAALGVTLAFIVSVISLLNVRLMYTRVVGE